LHEVPLAQLSGELHIADPFGKVRGPDLRPGPPTVPADRVGNVLFSRWIVFLQMGVVGVDNDFAVVERAGGPVIGGVVEGQHAALTERLPVVAGNPQSLRSTRRHVRITAPKDDEDLSVVHERRIHRVGDILDGGRFLKRPRTLPSLPMVLAEKVGRRPLFLPFFVRIVDDGGHQGSVRRGDDRVNQGGAHLRPFKHPLGILERGGGAPGQAAIGRTPVFRPSRTAVPVPIVGARSRHAVEGDDVPVPAFGNRIVPVSGMVFLLPIHEQHSGIGDVRRVDKKRLSLSRSRPVSRGSSVLEPEHDRPFPKAIGFSGGGLLFVHKHLIDLACLEQLEAVLLGPHKPLFLEGLGLRGGARYGLRGEHEQTAPSHHIELVAIDRASQELLPCQRSREISQPETAIGEQHCPGSEPHHLRFRVPADFDHRTIRGIRRA